jgi:hypothetical protein
MNDYSAKFSQGRPSHPLPPPDPGLKRGAMMTTRTPFIEPPGGWFGGQAVLEGPHLTIRRPDPGK